MLGMLQALIVSVGDLLILKAGVESPVLFVLITIFVRLFSTQSYIRAYHYLVTQVKQLQSYCLYYKLQVVEEHSQFKLRHNFSKTLPYLPFTYAIDSLRETVGGIVPEILITKINYINVIWHRILRCRFNFKTCNRSIDEARI